MNRYHNEKVGLKLFPELLISMLQSIILDDLEAIRHQIWTHPWLMILL